MIRFVVGPDRRIVPDLAADLPGRGIWLSAKADVLEAATKKGAFARAARGQVVVPPDLAADITAALLRRIAETLGLARRAGQAIGGFAKAKEWMAAGRVGVVVQAKDGSAQERARFVGAARTLAVITPLDGASLGAIFGREHAVHVVVAPGRLAERLRVEAARLAGLLGENPLAGENPTDMTTPAAPPRDGMQDGSE